MACQTRDGLAGMSNVRMPAVDSASQIAFMIDGIAQSGLLGA